jgi:nucleoid DNA-binding protein
MVKITKIELAKLVAARTGENIETSKNTINAIIDVIIDEVAKDSEVIFSGFGKFYQKTSKARVGHNPKNVSKKIDIKPKTKLAFKVSQKQKKEVI